MSMSLLNTDQKNVEWCKEHSPVSSTKIRKDHRSRTIMLQKSFPDHAVLAVVSKHEVTPDDKQDAYLYRNRWNLSTDKIRAGYDGDVDTDRNSTSGTHRIQFLKACMDGLVFPFSLSRFLVQPSVYCNEVKLRKTLGRPTLRNEWGWIGSSSRQIHVCWVSIDERRTDYQNNLFRDTTSICSTDNHELYLQVCLNDVNKTSNYGFLAR